MDGFCWQGELDLTLFVSKGITRTSLVVILGSKYIVSLHLTLYLILNLNFNLTFCNLLFFSIISNAIISFLCTAFLGICLSACFGNIVDFQNIITDFAHNIHKIITCKNNEYI